MKWKIFWLIIVLWLIGAAGLAFHVSQLKPPDTSSIVFEVAKAVFLWIGGLGLILPTYLNVWQSLETAARIEAQQRFQLIENAFELIVRWDDESLLKARDFTRNIKKSQHELSPNDLKKQIEEDKDLERSLVLVCNFIEKVRISIENKRVDIGIVKDSLGPVIVDIIKRFDPWIKSKPHEYQRDIEKARRLLEE